MAETREPRRRPTTRRTVLAAAWTVPVVQLATAAPAHAMSGASVLAVDLVPPVRLFKPLTTRQDLVNAVAYIRNLGAQSTTALTVIVDVVHDPSARFDFTNASAEPGPGFVLVELQRPPGIDRRFVFDAVAELEPDAVVSFSAMIDLDIGSAGRLTVQAVPGGIGTSDTASATFL